MSRRSYFRDFLCSVPNLCIQGFVVFNETYLLLLMQEAYVYNPSTSTKLSLEKFLVGAQ